MLAEIGDGGPQDNLFNGEEHGKPNLFDFRGQLLWEGDKLTVRALAHGGIDKSEKVAWKGPGIFNLGAPGLCPELFTGEVTEHPSTCPKYAGFAILAGFPEGEFEPEGTYTINQNTPPDVDDTFYGGYLRWDYDLGFATLTSITAYEYYERIHRDDSQSDMFDSTSTHYYNEMNQITQELRLVGQLAEEWRYVLGFFYESDDLDQVDGSDLSQQPLPGVAPPFADQFFSQFKLDTESAAMFAHTEYDFTPTLTLNAGVRFTTDSIEVDDALLGLGNLPQVGDEKFVTPCLITTFPGGPIGTPACPFLGPIAPFFNDDRRDNNFSWRLGMEWHAADNVMIYGNLTTGYRSGGYSLPFAGAATEFEPEKLFAQEFGFKSQWLENSLQVNASMYQYLYDDVQVNVDDPVSPLVPITRNIGKQKNNGAELEIEWAPDERWFLRQSVGWLHAVYEDTDRVITTYAGPIPLDGKHPVNSPKWTYNGFARFTHPLMAGWSGSVGVDYRWVDDRYLEATNQVFDLADAYWLVNLRGSVFSDDGRWEASVYATNLFDEDYLSYINNIAFFKLDIFGEPRTVGATIRYRFQ
jgi:iron complex outermembrane receptor protein